MLIIYISMLLPCYYLYQFSKKINSLIILNNLSNLESAFGLSKFFHFIGIFVPCFNYPFNISNNYDVLT